MKRRSGRLAELVELSSQEHRIRPADEPRAQHALDPGLRGRGAVCGRDALRDHVGLLGRQPALLDREARHVADRVDVGQTDDAAELVCGDEAGAVGRQPGDPGPPEPGRGDDTIGLDRLSRGQHERAAAVDLLGFDVSEEAHAALSQQMRDEA